MPIRYTSAGSPEALQRIKAAGTQGGDIDLLYPAARNKIAGFKAEGVLDDLRKQSALIPNLAKTEPPDNETSAGTGRSTAPARHSSATATR